MIRNKTYLLAAASLTATLSACSAVDRVESIGATPKLDPIATPMVQPTSYQPVTMPTEQSPLGPRQANSLWAPNARSFFHDPRASHVGDLLTIDITIADAAKLSDATTRTRTNSDDANLTNFFGLENQLTKLGMDPSSLVKMGSDTSNVGAGSIDRSEDITLTLAGIVSQVLPNGNLVVGGHQQVRVNNELRDLQIGGIVRTEDITSDNTVNLSQIAEARVSYGGKGQITDFQQPRYGSQLFDILMPF
jgi:flagellar L-ring protein precursor FlgH